MEGGEGGQRVSDRRQEFYDEKQRTSATSQWEGRPVKSEGLLFT